MENKKVLLGMSGGVDSSVSALLLKEQGYEVIGTTLELFAGSSCCNINTYIDAKNVCNSIGVPHFTYDYKNEFKEHVINDFIDAYANQRTPNPCIECNKYLKFGAMYEKAKELGCEYIATGHYAKMEYSEEYGRYVLKKANNIAKDQSYVLYNLPKELLGKVLFPLGYFKSKEEVREVARKNNLKTASKPDSEDICFIPDGNYKKFLENNSNIKPKEGNIVNVKGEILGKHKGLYNYTIGQRKGLIDELTQKMKVNVKTRYSSKEEPATIEMMENGYIKVVFDKPVQRITPGQSAVFYIDDIVLGGGKIVK